MKRILSSILAFALILCQSIIVSAKGIETKADEDAVATAVSVKILTDAKVYNRLIAE